MERRKDKKGRVLKQGETQRKDGTYDYRWRSVDGKRHSVYARTLEDLREKEKAIQKDKSDGIRIEARKVTVNDVYDLWAELKKGIKENTYMNYIYMYDKFVSPDFGKRRVIELKRSDVRRYYNILADERYMQIRTIETLHTVLHQVLDLAVEEGYLRNNPSDNAMKELKMTHNFDVEKRKALTVQEQKLFEQYISNHDLYSHWCPIFTVMLYTGLRVGEVTGLRWCDVDFDENTINVNHTLVYYKHRTNGCYFGINTPKTKAGYRTIPMLENVKQAFLMERERVKSLGITKKVIVDGYTDFIFLNRYGNVQSQVVLNKALRRIMRDCNQEILDIAKDYKGLLLLPRFSCHALRHTFATRLCESNTNIKVIQDVLGHADISTTMNIYTDATKELKEKEFSKLNIILGN